jgi:hypothetical protein
LIPLVTASNLPTGSKAVLSGALAFGIPEAGTLVAVAVMGKPGYEMIKSHIFRFLKQVAPPQRVSPNRCRVGLIDTAPALRYRNTDGAEDGLLNFCHALRGQRSSEGVGLQSVAPKRRYLLTLDNRRTREATFGFSQSDMSWSFAQNTRNWDHNHIGCQPIS